MTQALIVNGCSEVGKSTCLRGCNKENLSKVWTKEMDSVRFVGDPIRNENPIVCTFSGEELAQRKEELMNDVFSRVNKVKELASGYVFSFKYDEHFILKLTEYIITENECCPFFQFDIRLKSKNDVLLKMSGPQEAKEMIKMMLASGT